MKVSTLLLLSTVGLGLLGVSQASAAPANGVAISTTASADSLTEHVRWWGRGWGPGWGYRRAWGPGWGYRGWGPGWAYGGAGPGWCYYHPYRCGRW
jgi:hypothetical protein